MKVPRVKINVKGATFLLADMKQIENLLLSSLFHEIKYKFKNIEICFDLVEHVEYDE